MEDSDKFAFEGKWGGSAQTVFNSEGEEIIKYKEELEIKLVKTKPVQVYSINSSTWKDDESDFPLHFENGLLKLIPSGEKFKVETSFAHPFGLCEFSYGVYDPTTKEMISEATVESLLRGKSAKGSKTTGFKRHYQIIDDNVLHYKMYLGVEGRDLYHHLTANLSKIE